MAACAIACAAGNDQYRVLTSAVCNASNVRWTTDGCRNDAAFFFLYPAAAAAELAAEYDYDVGHKQSCDARMSAPCANEQQMLERTKRAADLGERRLGARPRHVPAETHLEDLEPDVAVRVRHCRVDRVLVDAVQRHATVRAQKTQFSVRLCVRLCNSARRFLRFVRLTSRHDAESPVPRRTLPREQTAQVRNCQQRRAYSLGTARQNINKKVERRSQTPESTAGVLELQRAAVATANDSLAQ